MCQKKTKVDSTKNRWLLLLKRHLKFVSSKRNIYKGDREKKKHFWILLYNICYSQKRITKLNPADRKQNQFV